MQRAQFLQERKQRQRDLRSRSGYTAQQAILLPPYRAAMYPIAQVSVEVIEFLQQAADMGLYARANLYRGATKAVLPASRLSESSLCVTRLTSIPR